MFAENNHGCSVPAVKQERKYTCYGGDPIARALLSTPTSNNTDTILPPETEMFKKLKKEFSNKPCILLVLHKADSIEIMFHPYGTLGSR